MIATFIKIFFVVWFVGSAIYVHQRGKIKMPLRHQLTGFFTFLAPFNIFWYLFSKVPNTPYIDRSEFPELQVLRDNWTVIRDEVLALNEQGHLKPGTGVAFKTFYKEDRWRRYYLSWYGKKYKGAQEHLPKTLAMIESIPCINAAIIARLNPGKTLTEHRDPFSISLRYHLGLVTPNSDDCRIVVDGEPYSWRDGEDVIFDETFIHEATNDTDEERMILFCDLQRPMNGPISRWFARLSHKIIGFLTVANNDEIEHKSAFNDFYEKILYPTHLKLRGVKRKNRKLYYTLKYLLFGSIIALILL